jgi:hypothetical protein
MKRRSCPPTALCDPLSKKTEPRPRPPEKVGQDGRNCCQATGAAEKSEEHSSNNSSTGLSTLFNRRQLIELAIPCRPPSCSVRISWRQAASSPISACTDQGRSPFGAPLVTEYRHHHPAGRHRHHPRCCSRLCSRGSSISSPLITHRFKLDQILDAYETFGHAASTGALKVIIEARAKSGPGGPIGRRLLRRRGQTQQDVLQWSGRKSPW